MIQAIAQRVLPAVLGVAIGVAIAAITGRLELPSQIDPTASDVALVDQLVEEAIA